MSCKRCNKPADIKIHGHLFCLDHYDQYYYQQKKGVLPFEFITEEKPVETVEKKEETLEDLFGDFYDC